MALEAPTAARARGRSNTGTEASGQSCTFDDVGPFSDAFRWWENEIAQIDAGVFSGRRTLAPLGNVSLMEERSNRALRQRGSILAGQGAVGFICGADAATDVRVLVCAGGADYDVFLPRDHVAFYLSMDAFRMHELLETCWPATFSGNPGRVWLDFHLPSGRTFSRQIRRILARASSNAGAFAVDKVRAHVADRVLAGLVESLAPVSRPHVNRRVPLERVVRRSLEFTDAHPDASINVGDLCKQVGASRRTLQRAFVERVGLSPHEFLLSLRMNGVRRALQSGDAESVTAEATRWGFWHLGRFAAYYRRTFGEQPSATLRRTAPAR